MKEVKDISEIVKSYQGRGIFYHTGRASFKEASGDLYEYLTDIGCSSISIDDNEDYGDF